MSNQEKASAPDSDPPYNSNFIVKPTPFSSKSNYFYRDGEVKLKTMFQKKSDQINNDNNNNNPAQVENTIQVPVLDEKTAQLMSKDSISSYSGDFYKGIFFYQNLRSTTIQIRFSTYFWRYQKINGQPYRLSC